MLLVLFLSAPALGGCQNPHQRYVQRQVDAYEGEFAVLDGGGWEPQDLIVSGGETREHVRITYADGADRRVVVESGESFTGYLGCDPDSPPPSDPSPDYYVCAWEGDLVVTRIVTEEAARNVGVEAGEAFEVRADLSGRTNANVIRSPREGSESPQNSTVDLVEVGGYLRQAAQEDREELIETVAEVMAEATP
ncbi:hypothetical protein [Allosalinactinospora lopnorensis]|uniref:hypothetical protein n=1 Tax=Allosalinactinospora lopnorensis TaxID=1352348 RepID=UPI000623D8AF|nr:hypothetical protein [Allosalinactinospora lopnorensis]